METRVDPPTASFPYEVHTKYDEKGAVASTEFFRRVVEPSGVEVKVPPKGYKGGGKGPPMKTGLPQGEGKGKGKAKQQLDKTLAGHWYTSVGNFKIEESKGVLRYIQGEVTGDLVMRSKDIWDVDLPTGAISFALDKVDGAHVLKCTLSKVPAGSDSGEFEARKDGNVFISNVIANAVLVKNHGLDTGDQVYYERTVETSPFLGAVDRDTQLYVRCLPGVPGGRLELYDSEANAKAGKKEIEDLVLSDAQDDSGSTHVTVRCGENHGYSDGEKVVISGIVDKSKLETKPWDKLNSEFEVADALDHTFKLKDPTGSCYFEASACVDKIFEAPSAKVCSLRGRQELDGTLYVGDSKSASSNSTLTFGKLFAKHRKTGGKPSGMTQLLGNLDDVKLKQDGHTLDEEDVDMSVDASDPGEKKQCPRCEKLFLLDFFDSHWECHSSEIMPNIFLGGRRNAENDVELTLRTGITHILNVASVDCPSAELLRHYCSDKDPPILFQAYKAMPLKDTEDFDLLSHLDEAVQFIRESLDQGERRGSEKPPHILVHCSQGISRSASCVIAYLMGPPYYMTLKDAYDHVKKHRRVARPNPAFVRQLGKREMELNPKLQTPTLSVEDVWPLGEKLINLEAMDTSKIAS